MSRGIWIGIVSLALVIIGVFAVFLSADHVTSGHYGLLMLALIVVAIMLGFPTAFTLMGLGMIFGFIAYQISNPGEPWRQNQIFSLIVQRTFGVMNNDVLISVPLFIFMGYIIERANLIDKLFRSVQLAMKNTPAALAVATIILRYFRHGNWHRRRNGYVDGLARAARDVARRIRREALRRCDYRRRLSRYFDSAIGNVDSVRGDRRRIGAQALRGRFLSGLDVDCAVHHLRDGARDD
jgi:Tripartite ATP-independent periplasmic transporter, DctM component